MGLSETPSNRKRLLEGLCVGLFARYGRGRRLTRGYRGVISPSLLGRFMATSKTIDEILDVLTGDHSKSHRDIWDEVDLDDFELEEMIDKFESEANPRRKWFISELIANRHQPASIYLFGYTNRPSN